MKIEYALVKPEDKYCKSSIQLKRLLQSQDDLKIKGKTIKLGKNTCSISIETELINNNSERLFKVILEQKDESKIKDLEEIRTNFRRIISKTSFGFQIVIINDDLAKYYCNKSYPIIADIEWLMRKVIYEFMLKKVGSNWINNSVKNDIKKKIETKAPDDESIVVDFLCHAQFPELSSILFVKYSNISDIESLFNKLDKTNDWNKEEIEKYRPLSNWDRYFKEHITYKELEEDWNKLNQYRISVMHNKIFEKEDFNKFEKLAEKIKEKLEEAFNSINEIKELSDKQKSAVQESVIDVVFDYPNPIRNNSVFSNLESIHNFQSMFTENANSLRNTMSDPFRDLVNTRKEFENTLTSKMANSPIATQANKCNILGCANSKMDGIDYCKSHYMINNIYNQ